MVFANRAMAGRTHMEAQVTGRSSSRSSEVLGDAPQAACAAAMACRQSNSSAADRGQRAREQQQLGVDLTVFQAAAAAAIDLA
jgi:hypothetical protein